MSQSPSVQPRLQQEQVSQQQFCCPQPADDDERECPACQAQMQRWAGFYRCQRCGFKESCCF